MIRFATVAKHIKINSEISKATAISYAVRNLLTPGQLDLKSVSTILPIVEHFTQQTEFFFYSKIINQLSNKN